jgi:subfamily B ATP-binding cassette protein MsbA
VKGFDAEAYEAEEFEMGNRRILAIFDRTISTETLISLLSQVTTGLLGIWVFYCGTRMVIAGRLSLGNYLTYNVLLAYILVPLSMAVTEGVRFTDAMASVERALEVLEEETEHDIPERNIHIGRIEGEISFVDVTFGYDESKPILHNLSFAAGPNQVIALVGPSGSGKSTIASLICGFHNPQIGEVTVDGVDLRTVKLTSYRRQLGVVFQESFLFRGTIRDNVAFAQPDATEEQVLAACRIARVDEFAERFADKYDTVVGERGVTLSGGQKQRVSIARALLRNPRLLILDEASSSLDYKSEAMVQEGLSALMQERTTIVIAHRLSTIRRADLILVLDNGRIVERGTHDELLATNGKYRSLYDQQGVLRDDL